MKKRTAKETRKTSETDITVTLNIDGTGRADIDTGIGFLDHMLELFAFHGFFDLSVKAKGDLKIDIHHTNEDVGLVLGKAFKKALGTMAGIRRFGYAGIPMEQTVGKVILDVNGRGFFDLKIGGREPVGKEGYEMEYARHFLEGFAKQCGVNLNVRIEDPSRDLHASLEPVFKALGVALDEATQLDPRRKGIPSTKGIID